jgi:Cu-processing system permease protein
MIKPVWALSKVTLRELLRDKLLYNTLLISFILLVVALLAAQVSIIRQDRILVDFGLTGLWLSNVVIAVLTGASMIGKELDRRTISVILSRPISRHQFLIGKYLGLSWILVLNWLLLSAVFFLMVFVFTSDAQMLWSKTLILSVFFALFQSLLLSAVAVFFSSFASTTVAVLLTTGVFAIGSNISQMLWLAQKIGDGWLAIFFRVLAKVWPNFEVFQIQAAVTYQLPITFSQILVAVSYTFFGVALALTLGGFIFERRDW